MQRPDIVWLHRAGTLQPVSFPASLQNGDVLYVGHREWLSGLFFVLESDVSPSTRTSYTVECYLVDEWAEVLPERFFENQQVGYIWDIAWNWQGTGVLYWGDVPPGHSPNQSSSSFPVPGQSPPSSYHGYWYRIAISDLSGAGVSVQDVYVVLYNTYTSVHEVSRFLGLPGFHELTVPHIDAIRRTIRAQEDWLDNYCRRTWRFRSRFAETADFNPYGIKPRFQPLYLVTRLGLWNGTAFEILEYGRGKQYFLDKDRGMIYFTLPSFRLRYYSFLLSRYLRQPASIVFDYVYGEDFDVSPQREDVRFIINRLVGHELVVNNDETGIFTSGLEVLTKREKAEAWLTSATERADTLRQVYATGLGAGLF
jgi:hypothetical protein